MSTKTHPYRPRTAVEVNTAGLNALIQALGVADTARFLRQYGPGLGDYTAERAAFLQGLSMEDVLRLIQAEEDGLRDQNT